MPEIATRYPFYQADQLRRDEIASLQTERLSQAVARALKSPWYAQQLAGLDPAQIDSLEALRQIPFTTKDDLRSGMPFGFLAVPLDQVVRMHYSSGTTGTATAVYHTTDDLQRWAECVARGMLRVGVTCEDVFQNMMGYGLFTGGLGLHYPAELIGCLTIPAGAGNTSRQIEIMKTFGTTALHILPSYGLRLAHSCREAGVVPSRDLNLRFAFVGAEPHSAQTRARLEQALDLKAYNVYGLSEMCGPGVAIECSAQDGLHLCEDHYLAEVIDPHSGKPLPDGEDGELVLTTLTRQATPLLRYCTRDITHIIAQPCPCGSQHRRIASIVGRTDDMLIVRGANVYPVQIEHILMAIPEIGSNYLITLATVDEMDEITVSVEISADYSYDDSRQLEALRNQIRGELQAKILFRPRVELVEPGSLPGGEGKAVRVVDKREK